VKELEDTTRDGTATTMTMTTTTKSAHDCEESIWNCIIIYSYNESSTYYEEDEDGYNYYYDPIFANITTRSPTSNVPRATRT